jgi:hypothetical protein
VLKQQADPVPAVKALADERGERHTFVGESARRDGSRHAGAPPRSGSNTTTAAPLLMTANARRTRITT